MKIELTNFSLFPDKTVFNIKPLTFLIGANNSGKSTFLKAMTIAANEHFYTNNFNIDSIKYHIRDSKKSVQISYEVSSNIFKELIWTTFDIPGEGLEDHLDVESLRYKNNKNEVILELKIREDLKQEKIENIELQYYVKLDLRRFYVILNEYNLAQDIDAFKNIFRNKLILDGFVLRPRYDEKFYSDYRQVEKWFFEKGVIDFIEKHTIEEISVNLRQAIIDYFIPFFRPISKRNNFNDKVDLVQIRNSELSIPKRVYEGNEFIVKQLLKRKSYFQHEEIDLDFVDKWMHKFFGSGSSIDVYAPFLPTSAITEIKLNGRHLTELGVGFAKILQLIHFLGSLSLNVTDAYVNFEDHIKKNTKGKIINAKIVQGFIDSKFIVIEEPETNLHPDFQVLLAEMIYDISQQSGYHIIVETHSEYMIRTMQYLVAKNPETSENVGILNFGSGKEIGKVKNIEIEPNGSLSDSFFSNFFHLAEDIKWKISALNQDRLN
jgi:energy-coupling factor transporter ATP-binding protein EcfA2